MQPKNKSINLRKYDSTGGPAIAERVNGILKEELVADHYPTLTAAKKGITQG